MITNTATITIGGTLITVPVELARVSSGVTVPVEVVGYAPGAISTADNALIVLLLLFGSLSVGLLTFLFLRMRVG
jgi:hypothetical protein